MPKRYAYSTSATQVKKRYAMISGTATQVKKRYAMIGSTATLVYQAQSDTYKLYVKQTKRKDELDSDPITNTEGYTKMVIESVYADHGGNYGTNRAKLYCDGVCIFDTGDKSTASSYYEAISSWGGTFPISQNGTVYASVYTDRNDNIDDHTDPISITVNFHFE